MKGCIALLARSRAQTFNVLLPRRLGFTIGYFDDGAGICAGEEYPPEEIEAACIDCYAYEKHATLGNWLGRLGKDWGVAISFAAFWISCKYLEMCRLGDREVSWIRKIRYDGNRAAFFTVFND